MLLADVRAGKSTVIGELTARGYRAIEIDTRAPLAEVVAAVLRLAGVPER